MRAGRAKTGGSLAHSGQKVNPKKIDEERGLPAGGRFLRLADPAGDAARPGGKELEPEVVGAIREEKGGGPRAGSKLR